MAPLIPRALGTAGLLFLLRHCIQRKAPKPLLQTSTLFHALASAQAPSPVSPDEQVDEQEPQLPPRAAASTPSTRRRLKADIRSESDPDRLAALLRTANLLHDRSPPLIAAAKLARGGRRDLVEQVLEERYAAAAVAVDAPAALMTERLLVRVMAVYSTCGMVFHAERAFHRIPEKTERSLRALLAVYADNRLPDRVRECFERVPADVGVAPGVSSCNVLVRALCDAGDVAGAEEFVRGKMLELDLSPDIFTYNTLLEAYLKKGDLPRFEKVVDEIGRNGLAQTLATYNSRMAMLCRTGHTGLAGKVFEEILAWGVCPSRTAYRTLISGSCREGRLDTAKRWLEELRGGKAGVVADGGSYTMVIRLMVERGEVAEAVELCDECLGKKGCALPFDVARGLVNGLVVVGKAPEARRVVELMRRCVKGPAELAWIKFEGTLPVLVVSPTNQ